MSQSNLTATIPMNMREDMVVSCYALNPSLGINEVGTVKVTVQCEWSSEQLLSILSGYCHTVLQFEWFCHRISAGASVI